MHFSTILIVESIPAGEPATGRLLYQALEPLPAAFERPVQIEHFSVANRAELCAFFDRVASDHIPNGHTPLLHFESHGNDDGIQLASGEFLSWEELCEYLMPLNVATRLNLFVSIAACLGGFLLTQQTPAARAPFFASLSATREAYPDELLGGFSRFYNTLLATLNGDEALANLQETTPEGLFYFAQALDSFKLTYSQYLSRECTRESYVRRAQIMREDLQETGRFAPSADAIARALKATEQQIFEQLREGHFMIDLYPENERRFPVTFAEVDRRQAD
jgi:hypothetical protein